MSSNKFTLLHLIAFHKNLHTPRNDWQIRTSHFALIGLLVVSSMSTFAQMPGDGLGGMGGGRPSMPPDGMKCPPPFKDGPPVTERVSLELLGAKETLQITAAQSTAWAKFEERTRSVVKDMLRIQQLRATSFNNMRAPQLIDQALDAPRNRLTALEDVSDSAKQLYELLTPDQRRVADARLTAVVRLLANPGPPMPDMPRHP